MFRFVFLSLTIILFSSPSADAASNMGQDGSRMIEDMALVTSDDVELYADLYDLDNTKPFILLFHQGGSNARGEYRDIIPALLGLGYSVIATDLRSGGQAYGSWNRTIAGMRLNPYGYCDALEDLRTVLNYITSQGDGKKVILWGSSYSAALVIRLAVERPELIKGVLAFSPAAGEPMAGCDPNEIMKEVTVPLMVLRPSNELQYDHVRQQFDMARDLGITVYEAENGVHGSSMLVEERVKGPVDVHWNAVRTFLDKLSGSDR